MPEGLSCAQRFFTKILNPVFAFLREQGHELFQYLDDLFVVADTKEKSLRVRFTTLSKLGFVIHDDKSVLTPTRRLKFLRFQLDSHDMTVELTSDKVQKL